MEGVNKGTEENNIWQRSCGKWEGAAVDR